MLALPRALLDCCIVERGKRGQNPGVEARRRAAAGQPLSGNCQQYCGARNVAAGLLVIRAEQTFKRTRTEVVHHSTRTLITHYWTALLLLLLLLLVLMSLGRLEELRPQWCLSGLLGIERAL